MIRVVLPHHLQTLANCDREITLAIDGIATQGNILDALEARYPMLRGTVREHGSMKRRPRVRFFADGEDVTHASPEAEMAQKIRRTAIVSFAPFRQPARSVPMTAATRGRRLIAGCTLNTYRIRRRK